MDKQRNKQKIYDQLDRFEMQACRTESNVFIIDTWCLKNIERCKDKILNVYIHRQIDKNRKICILIIHKFLKGVS